MPLLTVLHDTYPRFPVRYQYSVVEIWVASPVPVRTAAGAFVECLCHLP